MKHLRSHKDRNKFERVIIDIGVYRYLFSNTLAENFEDRNY